MQFQFKETINQTEIISKWNYIFASSSRTRLHNYNYTTYIHLLNRLQEGSCGANGNSWRKIFAYTANEWGFGTYLFRHFMKEILFWFHQHCGECSARYCVSSPPSLCHDMLCCFALGMVYPLGSVGRAVRATDIREVNEKREKVKRKISRFLVDVVVDVTDRHILDLFMWK